MGKGDPKKLRARCHHMHSLCKFAKRSTRSSTQMLPLTSQNFQMFREVEGQSGKDKGKFEEIAKMDKACYEREMKTYIPLKGETKRSSRIPICPRHLLPPPSCSVLSITQKSEENILASPIGDVAKKLGEMWNNTAADDKQPYKKKAAKLKGKYEKDTAVYWAKGKPDAEKKGVVKAEKSKKKKEEEDDEEDENEEEEEQDDDE